MDLTKIQETDFHARIAVRTPGMGFSEGYFETIERIRPLLESPDWKEFVTGYYINVASKREIDEDPYFWLMRLTYFTRDQEHTPKVISDFIKNSGLEKVPYNGEELSQARISASYGGEELRFRRFLAVYTQIGLDLLRSNKLHARRLFVTYRLQVIRSGGSCHAHFSNSFEKLSPTYNSLTTVEKSQFWSDLEDRNLNWFHFFINMILPCDPGFQRPLSNEEINNNYINPIFNLYLPDNWNPNSF
jgi:hypothetical protein